MEKLVVIAFIARFLGILQKTASCVFVQKQSRKNGIKSITGL
jgi:hypothetical protein